MRSNEEALKVGRPLLIVFLIDALGWEIVERFGFCRDLLSRRAPLGTVLGYSSAAIPSLLSGAPPSAHKAWAMWRLAKGNSPFGFLRALPRMPHPLEWRTRWLTRRITDRRGKIKGYYDLYEIPLRVLGHFDVAEHGDPYQPGGLPVETIFDRLVAERVPYRMWYYHTPEAENMQALFNAVDSEAGVLFLYTPELDALMHRVGVFDHSVERKLRGYERFLRSVIERGGGCHRDVTLCVLSDHGMTDVHTTVDLWGEVTKAGYRLGRDYLAFYDSTMARFWCGDAIRDRVAALLQDADAGRLLSEEELAAYGCLFEDHSYGNAIFLLHPGIMIVPSFMGKVGLAAMHGYDPADRYSMGCFLTTDTTEDLPGSILDVKRYLLARLPGGR